MIDFGERNKMGNERAGKQVRADEVSLAAKDLRKDI